MNVITCHQGHQNPEGARFCSYCGASLQALNGSTPSVGTLESGLPSGTKLRNRYIIQRHVGQGGFGRTYLAQDTGRFNESVVVKEFTPNVQGSYNLHKAEELFEREAMILHNLKQSQIPRFWEFFREGQQLYLVQEFIDGETYQSLLHQRLQQGATFSETEIIQLLQQLLPVLGYLHHLGIVHRDISPDNIICRAHDKLPVLIDLGGVKRIAINVAQQLAGSSNIFSSDTSTRLGKVGYAPDEQMRLGIVAPYSDLYALGVTAIVLMTGKQPQQLIDPETMNWLWERELPNINPQLREILSRMLAAKPYQRFQSSEEILDILQSRSGYPVPKTVFGNNSGQGNFLDNSNKVPPEIQGWNWGAFLLPGVWCLSNRVWIGLVAWADPTFIISLGVPWLTMGVILGIKGNEWAWRSRRWRSIAEFKAHQRKWAIAAWIIMGIITTVFLVFLVIIGLLIFFGIVSAGIIK